MKGTETPVINPKWWKDNKASSLKDPGLEGALRAYVEALEATEPGADPLELPAAMAAFDDAFEKLSSLGKMVEKTIAACKDGKHDETRTVLHRYLDSVLPKEKKRLEGLHEQVEGRTNAQIAKLRADCQVMAGGIEKAIEQVRKRLTDVEELEHEVSAAREAVVHAVAAKEDSGATDAKATADDKVKTAAGLVHDIEALHEHMLDATNKAYALVEKRLIAFAAVDPTLTRAWDPCETELGTIEALTGRAGSALDAMRGAASAIDRLAAGGVELEHHYREVCEAVIRKADAAREAIEADLRTIGGMLDRCSQQAAEATGTSDAAERESLLAESKKYLKDSIAGLAATMNKIKGAREAFAASTEKLTLAIGKSSAFADFVKTFTEIEEKLDGDLEQNKHLSSKAARAKADYEAAAKHEEEKET